MMEIDLKPCPFCGGKVTVEEEWEDAVSSFYTFNEFSFFSCKTSFDFTFSSY